ncbi:MAG: hypothetical protein MRERC_9c038 [Mycoplasmataceae bacterium RC_NB112A]|nr:MAG: hypothetical protein MRERC_9c038 [Mycoplasmataceae bacterium RC_NB112A]
MKNPPKSRFYLLTSAVFLHLFSIICSVYRDTYRWENGYRDINYWITFFSWWCAQASLITIIYFIYRIFKSHSAGYFAKVFDLIVIQVNLISIGFFTISALAGLLPLPKSSEIISLFGWKVSSRAFWWFYALIWHYLAPFLTLVYFVCRKTDLGKTYLARRKLFFCSFLHPLGYFILVLLRPFIPGSEIYPFSKELPNYPYFFFNWAGIKSIGHFFWTVTIILFWLFIFWLSILLFGKLAGHKIRK